MATATVVREGDNDYVAIWLQTPGESDNQFMLFQDYLNAGPARDLFATYRKHREDGRVKVKSLDFVNLDSTYRAMVNELRWKERAQAFDNWAYDQARRRHIQKMNDAVDVLFDGAVSAATTLVKATNDRKVTAQQIMACCAILDRCGIVARGSRYDAPIAVNKRGDAQTTQRVVVEFKNSTKSELEMIADGEDD